MKIMGRLLVMMLSVASYLCAKDIPEPYASIKVLPVDNFNYYINQNQIKDLFNNNDIRVINNIAEPIQYEDWIGIYWKKTK